MLHISRKYQKTDGFQEPKAILQHAIAVKIKTPDI